MPAIPMPASAATALALLIFVFISCSSFHDRSPAAHATGDCRTAATTGARAPGLRDGSRRSGGGRTGQAVRDSVVTRQDHGDECEGRDGAARSGDGLEA